MAEMVANLPVALRGHVADLGDYDADRQIRKAQRSALIASGALVIGLLGFGGLVPIGGAVIGSGQIGVESGVKKIAHPGGGTVAEILVHNGQQVKRGQLLIRLDDKVANTDASYAALTLDQMLAQKARLEAEQSGAGDVVFPAQLTARTDEAARKAMAEERQMFAMRRRESAGITAQLEARVSQYHQQIAGYRAQIASLRQQAALIAPERDSVRMLYEKKLVTLSRLNQLERSAVDLSGSIGSLDAQIAATEAHISETREQIIQMQQTRRTEAGTMLAQLNAQINMQQSRSAAAADLSDRTHIRAPVDGVVDKLAVTTIGGVIRPAEPIMDILPRGDAMLVEAMISPNDVDQVHVDQSARVRLSAISVAATPEIHGRVVYVGADRITAPDGKTSYFPVRIAIDPAELRKQTSAGLKAGMPAEIFVETGSRSMLSYLTKPLRDQFARAFRDN